MERAEARALRAEGSLQAKATLHKQELQNKDTAWRIYATAQQRNDRRSARERVIYWQVYDGLTEELMERERYRTAKDSQKAERLEANREKVLEDNRDQFLDWLAENRRSEEKKK